MSLSQVSKQLFRRIVTPGLKGAALGAAGVAAVHLLSPGSLSPAILLATGTALTGIAIDLARPDYHPEKPNFTNGGCYLGLSIALSAVSGASLATAALTAAAVSSFTYGIFPGPPNRGETPPTQAPSTK